MRKPTENEILYQRIINKYPGSILATDKNGVIFFASDGALELTGLNREELVHREMADIVRKGIFSSSSTLEALKTHKETVRYLTLKNGGTTDIMAISRPFFDRRGELEMVVAYSQDEAFVNDVMRQIQKEKNAVQEILSYLQDTKMKHIQPIAASKVTQELFAFAGRIAVTDSTVMLRGESGTGKEVVARYIHNCSKRKDRAFIPVNCAAIPSELMESEFFGYEGGAFTGAKAKGKPGLFELADKGTLFLDELGDLPLTLQSKLLRTLETGEVQRLGSEKMIFTDVRIVTATNRDLRLMIERGKFRGDLFYRLNVIPIEIPPLRSRVEDIIPLATVFLEHFNKKYGFHKNFGQKALKQMKLYAWPGNVRELKNMVERMVITSVSDVLALEGNCRYDDLKLQPEGESFPDDGAQAPEEMASLMPSQPLKEFLKSCECRYVYNIIAECGGDKKMAAERLGIHRSSLYRKLDEYACGALL